MASTRLTPGTTKTLSDFVYLDTWTDGDLTPYYFVMQKIAQPNIFEKQAIIIGGDEPVIHLDEDGKTVLKVYVTKSATRIYHPDATQHRDRFNDLIEMV